MTDARFPDYWMHDGRIQSLTAEHFRAFMHALAWSAHNRTDGVIRAANVGLIARLDRAAVAAFVAAGLCVELDDGWLIIDYLATQTTRVQLESNERQRAKDRERKAKERADKLAAQQGVHTDVRPSFPGRQAGRLLSNPTTYVSSEPQTFDSQPPDDDEPGWRDRPRDGQPVRAEPKPPEDELTDAERAYYDRNADENMWRSYDQ